jgi:uncharacterized membrane protein YhaH (DUF805 family)
MNNMLSSLLVSLIVFVVVLAIFLPPQIKILHKAGYSGGWILISFIPIVNIVMIWVFAYADWPSLARARSQV